MCVPRLYIIIQIIIIAKVGDRIPSPSLPSPAAAIPSTAMRTSPKKLNAARIKKTMLLKWKSMLKYL